MNGEKLYRFVVATLIFLIRMYGGLVILVPSIYIKNIMRELSITSTEVGFLISSTMIACLIFIMLTGLVVDKFGAKNTVLFAIVLTTLGGFLIGNAPNFGIALIGRFILGMGITWFIPATMPIIMTWFTSKDYGKINAFLNSSMSVGLMMHFFLTPVLFPPPVWREPHIVYATMGIFLMILWILFGKGPKVEMKRDMKRDKFSFGELIKIKEIWLLGIVMFSLMGVGSSMSSWLPTYLEMKGFPIFIASTIMGFYNLIGIISSPVGGFISDRIGLRRPFIIVSGILTFISFIGLINTTDTIQLFIFMTGVGWFASFATFSITTIPMEIAEISHRKIPFATSIIVMFGFIGQIVFVPMVGYMITLIPFYYTLFIVGLFYLLTTIAGMLCRETGCRVAQNRV
ncbi:MAG: MFS transporter [Candidatus Methanomethyliaceae archaeon]|nr:MFS transporter [Candidatus Methanomethyliaceae archaeon]MDW7970635.1 MFS transporter [Nitrososphaerota archaeon]